MEIWVLDNPEGFVRLFMVYLSFMVALSLRCVKLENPLSPQCIATDDG